MPFLYLSKTHRHPMKFSQMWKALALLKAIETLENEGYSGRIDYRLIGKKLYETRSPYVRLETTRDKTTYNVSEKLVWELATLHFLRMKKKEYRKKGDNYPVHTFFWSLSHDPFRQPQLIRDSLEFYGKKSDPLLKKTKVMANAAQHP